MFQPMKSPLPQKPHAHTQPAKSLAIPLVPHARHPELMSADRSLTFLGPYQKCESLGPQLVADSGWFTRYLLCNISCQSPSEFSSFHNLFINKHLFITYKSKIPKPPQPFGMQIVGQFTIWYLLFSCDSCQTILDRSDVYSLDKCKLGARKKIFELDGEHKSLLSK